MRFDIVGKGYEVWDLFQVYGVVWNGFQEDLTGCELDIKLGIFQSLVWRRLGGGGGDLEEGFFVLFIYFGNIG